MIRIFSLFLALLLTVPNGAYAAEEENAVITRVQRFATLDSGEVNVRTGPGVRYPIKFILHREGWPVEVRKEFDVWRYIREKDGDEGWVHQSLLSGKRAVIVTALSVLRRGPEASSAPVVKAEPGVVAALERCAGEGCAVKIAGYRGWLARKDVWGVYADETFDK